MNNNQSSWHQYERLVISELERHDKRLDNFDKEVVDMKVAQARIAFELAKVAPKPVKKSGNGR